MTREKLMKNVFQWGALTAIVAVAWPDLSWAQGSIGDSLNLFRTTDVSAVAPLVNGVAYTAGAVLGVSGALKLKAHAENPASEKLAPGVGRLLAGGAVAALPTVIRTAYETLHMSQEISFKTIQTIS